MGKCKDCKRPILTWWGSRCWVCTAKYVERQTEIWKPLHDKGHQRRSHPGCPWCQYHGHQRSA